MNNGVNPKMSLSNTTQAAGFSAQSAKNTPEKKSFREVWSKIQTQMGAKPEKPRTPKKTLGKDEFLKIMIHQMRHQDPTKPYDAEKMAEQLAQLTSVEQLQNMNKRLESMADQNKPLERLAMTNLIGKSVVMDRSRFLHMKGNGEALSFALPEDAQSVNVSLISDRGETVYENDLGSKPAGPIEFSWDGNKKNSLPADAGHYYIRVVAKSENDRPIKVETQNQVRISGVSFQGHEPVFIVSDGTKMQKIQMSDIVQIQDQAPQVIQGIDHPMIASNQDISAKRSGEDVRKQAQLARAITPQMAPVEEKPDLTQNGVVAFNPKAESSRSLPAERGFPNGLGEYNQTNSNNGNHSINPNNLGRR